MLKLPSSPWNTHAGNHGDWGVSAQGRNHSRRTQGLMVILGFDSRWNQSDWRSSQYFPSSCRVSVQFHKLWSPGPVPWGHRQERQKSCLPGARVLHTAQPGFLPSGQRCWVSFSPSCCQEAQVLQSWPANSSLLSVDFVIKEKREGEWKTTTKPQGTKTQRKNIYN